MNRSFRMASSLALLLAVRRNSIGWVSSPSSAFLPAGAMLVASFQHPSFGSKTNTRRTQQLASLHLLRTDRRRRNLVSTTTTAAATDVPMVHHNDSAVGASTSWWTGDTELPVTNESSTSPTTKKTITTKQLLIHWKGEAVIGSSLQFRHCEFNGALGAVLLEDDHSTVQVESMVQFSNALQYKEHDKPTKDPFMTAVNIQAYNEAMQYFDIVAEGEQAANTTLRVVSTQDCIRAVQRCSLIHALYEIVAETNEDTYDGLAVDALANGAFEDMTTTTSNATWCVRVRHYGVKGNEIADIYKERRYGYRARSMALEQQALQALKPLLLTFRGPVNLENPDCKIYILDGLTRSTKVLARRIATGARRAFALLEPNTRHCVTTTPLGAVAAYTLVNVARVRAGDCILDPYAGSGTILLAAALVAASTTASGTVQSVGIEVAHNGYVNRNDIRTDFVTRRLTLPAALIHGDCRHATVRRQALDAVGRPFDCIITDPPYGIRESIMASSTNRPIDDLLAMIVHHRDESHGASTGSTTRLLRLGGRLVVFLPQQTEEQSLQHDVLPSPAQLEQAGLECELMREQPLNDKLSRWLVCYKCIR